MSMDTQKTGQLGINVIERIILRDWHSRWQPIDSYNDDGIDGLIFLEANGIPTGQIIFVQVKCTKNSPGVNGMTSVPISAAKLAMNIERWRRVVGAAILVHVNAKTLQATWVNLREDSAITTAQVKVPSSQLFDAKARKKVAALCGTLHRDMLMPRLVAKSSDFSYLTDRFIQPAPPKKNLQEAHIQIAARKYYREHLMPGINLAKNGPLVQFSREGWRHITRPERNRLVALQSLQLLGVVRRMISMTEEKDLKDIRTRQDDPKKYKYIIAAVSFPFRQTGVVKVILREHSGGTRAKYSLHSIYEPRRKRDMRGNM